MLISVGVALSYTIQWENLVTIYLANQSNEIYNRVWLHFELLREVITQPKQITNRKLFGVYLHAITVHAPVQFQTMSMRSCNTEHEERLFGQAKEIATNKTPESIVPNILIRLQAKQKGKTCTPPFITHTAASLRKLMV